MTNRFYLFLALLTAWISAGALMYEESCCSEIKVVKSNPIKTRWYYHGIKIKNEDFSLKLNDNFIFYKSTSSYLSPLSDSLTTALGSISDYLISHPDKMLKIICRYNPNESIRNNNDWGYLRAKEIEKLFLTKGVNAQQLIPISLRDSLLPIKNNRIFGGFIPLIVQNKKNK